jgi:beta-N-acetylhexosaminidase
MSRKAIIFGIKGYYLTKKEMLLFKKEKPWGIILFSRNIQSIDQLKKLVDSIKIINEDKNFPVLIDQEGGSVSRLNKIMDFSLFSQNYFTKLLYKDKKNFIKYYKIYIDSVSSILNYVGININTVPVLDIRRKNSHKIIGERSFSNNKSIVTMLGKTCINFYEKNKIATVMKHIPGHGLSKTDTHLKESIVRTSKNKLLKKDFYPFKKCKSKFAMTAHIIYSSIDPNNLATHSKILIKEIIRNHINFKGILISDDISMKALKTPLAKSATKALNSGCNIVLHCNGKIKEMEKLVKVIPKIDNFTKNKTSQFNRFLM